MKYLLLILIILFSVSCYEEEETTCKDDEIFNNKIGYCVIDMCQTFENKDSCIEGCGIRKERKTVQCEIR